MSAHLFFPISGTRLSAGLLTLLCTVRAVAQPQPIAEPRGVVSLTASASADIPRDWIAITLTTAREGADAATVQSALKQALEAALVQARRVERSGDVEVRTGQFALSPRYVKGQSSGWRGSTELIVEGRDFGGIAQLTGQITTMTIGRVQQSLSRQRRAEAEGGVTGRAIAAFRARATEITRHFGYASHVLREVSVSSLDQPPPTMPMMRAQASAMASDEALPIQAGNETVSVTVQGSVQLVTPP